MASSAKSCCVPRRTLWDAREAIASVSVTPDMGQEDVSQAPDRDAETLGFTRRRSHPGRYAGGGTPCNTALLKTKNITAEVLTGVNLYMVLSSFTHRDQMDLKSLAAKVAEDGRRAIVAAKDLLAKRLS